MQLEFLSDGSPECPLIRLFDFTPAEAGRLKMLIADLASGRAACAAVHKLRGVVAVGGCELVFRVCDQDRAVLRVGPSAFECGFTVGTWDNVAGLVEPFTTGGDGYQWLAGIPGDAALLFSASGQW